MADGITLNPGTGGRVVATDDISDGGVADGKHAQRIKPGFGTDGNYSDVADDNPLPVVVTDGTNKCSIDPEHGAQIVIDVDHHEVHEGGHYFVKTWLDVVGEGTVTYMMFRAPDSATRIHARSAIAAEAEFTVEIFEDAVVSADGASLTTRNNDRNSSNTPDLVAFSGPTVTSDGSLIWAAKVGAGKTATVSVGTGYEIIAKQNSNYLFKITKSVAGTHWLDVDFWWYEVS